MLLQAISWFVLLVRPLACPYGATWLPSGGWWWNFKWGTLAKFHREYSNSVKISRI